MFHNVSYSVLASSISRNASLAVIKIHTYIMNCRFTQNTSFSADITAHSAVKGLLAGMNSPLGKCEESCCLTVEYELGDGSEKAELVIFRLFENSGIPYEIFSRRGLCNNILLYMFSLDC